MPSILNMSNTKWIINELTTSYFKSAVLTVFRIRSWRINLDFVFHVKNDLLLRALFVNFGFSAASPDVISVTFYDLSYNIFLFHVKH